VNTFLNYLNTEAMDLKTKNRIKILTAIAKAKNGNKLIKKKMKVVKPNEVPTKKDFESKPFKY
jgi:hypothetical protein